MLVTVSFIDSTLCPASTVLKVAPVNSVAPLSPSVKVGEAPVAVRVGSSLSAATVTVEATERAFILSFDPALEPLSTISVRVTTRLLPVEGS